MANKTLSELRTSVRSLYGDEDGVTAVDAEVDLFLKDGVNMVLSRCPWIYVTTPATHNLTTDAMGAAVFDDENIGQSWTIEMRQSDTMSYRLLQPSHAGLFSDPEYIVANSVDEVYEYVLDGNRIQFYPVLESTACVIRTTFASNSIGTGFPTVTSNKLPNNIPVQAEEAAIIYAVQKLNERDNNYEAAAFLRGDFESRMVMLTAEHNRPQRGRVKTVFNEDVYVLDATDDAW